MSTLATNKRARSDYDLVSQFEGGLVLTGAEVKAAKQGNVSLRGAFIRVRDNELWLKNMHIGHYAPSGKSDDYDPTRERKVLVHKKELKLLIDKSHAQGLTIVPIRVYTKGTLVKISFALARGKRKHEKREDIKKRDLDRQAREEMKKTRFGS